MILAGGAAPRVDDLFNYYQQPAKGHLGQNNINTLSELTRLGSGCKSAVENKNKPKKKKQLAGPVPSSGTLVSVFSKVNVILFKSVIVNHFCSFFVIEIGLHVLLVQPKHTTLCAPDGVSAPTLDWLNRPQVANTSEVICHIKAVAQGS